VAAFEGLNKFKMAAVAMVTKVQKMLNSLPTSQSFAGMFPVIHFEFYQHVKSFHTLR
jgi:hypothetical protein